MRDEQQIIKQAIFDELEKTFESGLIDENGSHPPWCVVMLLLERINSGNFYGEFRFQVKNGRVYNITSERKDNPGFDDSRATEILNEITKSAK